MNSYKKTLKYRYMYRYRYRSQSGRAVGGYSPGVEQLPGTRGTTPGGRRRLPGCSWTARSANDYTGPGSHSAQLFAARRKGRVVLQQGYNAVTGAGG